MTEKKSIEKDPTYRRYVPFLNISYNLYMHIFTTYTALYTAGHNATKHLNATHMEIALLTIVSGLGGAATPAEIARWLMRKRSTISGLLNRMERNGLIERSGYENNKKLRKVTLTEKGREILGQMDNSDVLKDYTGALSDEEFQQLWYLLEKLQQAVHEHVEF